MDESTRQKLLKTAERAKAMQPSIEIGLAKEFSALDEKLETLSTESLEIKDVVESKLSEISENLKKKSEYEFVYEIDKESLKGDKGDVGENGKDGRDGKNGINGKDGIDGIDGKDGLDGKDGSPDTSEEIATKLNTLDEAVEIDVVKGLRKALEALERLGQNTTKFVGGSISRLRVLSSAVNVKENASEIDFGTNLTVTPTANGVRVDAIGGASGVTDHGDLTGLADDDHTQYHNDARGDARYSQLGHTHTASDITDLNTYDGFDYRYYTISEVDTALSGKANSSHTHTASQITDFDTEVSNNTDVSANTTARHTHANLAVLDATTASFTTADETKLDGIQAGAEVNVNADWNAVSGDAQILNKPTVPTNAFELSYNNVTSGLTATNTQDAIDEILTNPSVLSLSSDDIPSNGPFGNDNVTEDLFTIDERLADLEIVVSPYPSWWDLIIGSVKDTPVTIAEGTVTPHDYQGTTYYRLSPSPSDPAEDNFYLTFNGTTLSDLVIKRVP